MKGGMPPRVFCKKSAEVIENKGSECEKERKERKRVRKRLKTKGHLGGQWQQESKGCENTPGCGKKEGPNGDTSANLVVDYRIRYYLSSEKLKAVS